MKNKNLKLKETNSELLKGVSLDKQNKQIKILLEQNGINHFDISFQPEKLQEYIDQKKTFGRGLVAYLHQLEDELNQIDDRALQLMIFQRLSELGSLVFPNTAACYSLVPNDLKKINWTAITYSHKQQFNKKNMLPPRVEALINGFLDNKHEKTISCLISLFLCAVLIRSYNKETQLLVKKENESKENGLDQSPRIKAADWINQLSYNIQVHLMGLHANVLKKNEIQPLISYTKDLAVSITEQLLAKKLIVSFETVKTKSSNQRYKSSKYFVWRGSNLLIFPKTLALPMVSEPDSWQINANKGADNGGYLLSGLTNVSYQGFLDSKSSRVHDHRLILKHMDHINSLQNVKFSVHEKMVLFYKKYEKMLSDNNVLLLSDKWLNATPETYEKLVMELSRSLKPGILGDIVNKELIAKSNETLRTQETLEIAGLYCNKPIYWPVVQDFRGRIYRIGNLNIQLDDYNKSLITFYSNQPPIKRRKQSKKAFQKYCLLLKEVLIKDDLIKQWDCVFGDRLISNDKFEQLLLEELLAGKLSLIQVNQLLLIRYGEYDKVGVYYDASASAYQIMGVINVDKGLCELTNVLKTDGAKSDIYTFFLNQFKKNMDRFTLKHKQSNIAKQLNDYFRANFDRQLVKRIVMPLIYGKTSKGFAEDLKEFFEKDKLYPSHASLITVASQIIKTLKEDPVFAKVNIFMKALRAIGGCLFDCNQFWIKGYYNDCHITYYKEESEEIRLYYKSKDSKYNSQRIKLNRPIFDSEGNFIKSKTKTINAFVANYIHFLDATVCHYVIDNFLQCNNNVNIGTIHDSFFIKPDQVEQLRGHYKQGLILAHKLHVYNMHYWLYEICKSYKNNNFTKFDSIIDVLKQFITVNAAIEVDPTWDLTGLPTPMIIEQLSIIKLDLDAKSKNRFDKIIDYFKTVNFGDMEQMQDILTKQSGALLFPDN